MTLYLCSIARRSGPDDIDPAYAERYPRKEAQR